MANLQTTYEKLLGVTKVCGKDGEVDVSSFSEKTLCLYFSAHWCPPCRGFTPKLAEYYNKFAADKNFEIVFVSSDKDQAAFDGYFAEHPWLALPFPEREMKAQLSKQFKVNGIPSFVVVGTDGQLITANGRDGVTQDTNCERFPWRPKTFAEIMDGATYNNKKGDSIGFDTFTTGKVWGIYFSAHWCPPCRGFTPKLVETYNKLKEQGKDFEIIFCSSDRDEKSFDEYYAEMPWACLPYKNRDLKAALSKHFDVSGIPMLIILDGQGKVITADGTSAVGGDAEGAEFPWHPKPLNDFAGGAGAVNDLTSLCAFCPSADETTKEKVKADMKQVAEAHWASSKAAGKEPEFAFFTCFSLEGMGGPVKEAVKVNPTGNEVEICVIDIPGGGMHYHSDLTTTSSEGLEAFMKTYKDAPKGKLREEAK